MKKSIIKKLVFGLGGITVLTGVSSSLTFADVCINCGILPQQRSMDSLLGPSYNPVRDAELARLIGVRVLEESQRQAGFGIGYQPSFNSSSLVVYPQMGLAENIELPYALSPANSPLWYQNTLTSSFANMDPSFRAPSYMTRWDGTWQLPIGPSLEAYHQSYWANPYAVPVNGLARRF